MIHVNHGTDPVMGLLSKLHGEGPIVRLLEPGSDIQVLAAKAPVFFTDWHPLRGG